MGEYQWVNTSGWIPVGGYQWVNPFGVWTENIHAATRDAVTPFVETDSGRLLTSLQGGDEPLVRVQNNHRNNAALSLNWIEVAFEAPKYSSPEDVLRAFTSILFDVTRYLPCAACRDPATPPTISNTPTTASTARTKQARSG